MGTNYDYMTRPKKIFAAHQYRRSKNDRKIYNLVRLVDGCRYDTQIARIRVGGITEVL